MFTENLDLKKADVFSIKHISLFAFLLFLPLTFLNAQGVVVQDSLEAARITALRRLRLETGAINTSVENLHTVVSPLGEGDAIRWVQALPGVSTGADGTSSYYVRGGNSGGNLLTIDGVPVFGYSHILGITTILPNEVLESASFKKGGYMGGQGNYTSSHLDIRTLTPHSSSQKLYVSLNNFLAGSGVIAPIGEKLSMVAAGRISPLTLEYKALKGMAPEGIAGLRDFGASVYDLFGKIVYRINDNHQISLSGIGSVDRYSILTSDSSNEIMGWGNAIGILQSHHVFGKGIMDFSASYNVYNSIQEQEKQYKENDLNYFLQSSLNELTLFGDFSFPIGQQLRLSAGLKERFASFAPGQHNKETNFQNTSLATGYIQGSLSSKAFHLDGCARLNWFNTQEFNSVSPDVNFSAKWQVAPFLALEGTFDYMSQFYHLLEGLPLGWSMDLMIPSSEQLPAEVMTQGYAGLVFTFGKSTFSAGVFIREMDNLVYYKNARNFFTAVQSSWQDDVDVGKGDAKGVELLYEYLGKDFYAKASATIGKATRKGFQNVNEGQPFHAPFDRRVVSNITAEWKGVSLTFIYQDGNWVNGRGEKYQVPLLGGDEASLEYYSSVNNHQMSPIIRLDVGYHLKWRAKRTSHDLNLGICNLLNHFNPFTVYYDTKDGKWKELSLLPILPNFSYKISF